MLLTMNRWTGPDPLNSFCDVGCLWFNLCPRGTWRLKKGSFALFSIDTWQDSSSIRFESVKPWNRSNPHFGQYETTDSIRAKQDKNSPHISLSSVTHHEENTMHSLNPPKDPSIKRTILCFVLFFVELYQVSSSKEHSFWRNLLQNSWERSLSKAPQVIKVN